MMKKCSHRSETGMGLGFLYITQNTAVNGNFFAFGFAFVQCDRALTPSRTTVHIWSDSQDPDPNTVILINTYWDFFRHWLLAMSDCSTCHLLQKPHLGEWWCYFDESSASLWECNPSSMPSVMKSSLNTSIISKKSLPQKFFLTLPKRS